MTVPALSVVVPSYRGAERLPRTLSSLEGTEIPGGFEVIVVDDGSPDETAGTAGTFAGRLPLSVVRHETNRGRAAARNSGIRQARGPVVLLLDDDMRAEPGLAARHAALHRGGDRVAGIGRIVQEGLDDRDPFHAFLRREEAGRRTRLLTAPSVGFGDVWTGQFSVRREDALAAGLLDERIRSYGLEDVEFGYRLALHGVRFIYVDEAISRHAAFADTLERYCARQRSVGQVAAYIARRHDTPEMRRYLRIDAERRDGPSLFVRLMDVSSALLRRRRAAAFLAGPVVRPVLRAGVALCEAARLDRPLSLLYSLLRDIQYFHALGHSLESGRGGRR